GAGTTTKGAKLADRGYTADLDTKNVSSVRAGSVTPAVAAAGRGGGFVGVVGAVEVVAGVGDVAVAVGVVCVVGGGVLAAVVVAGFLSPPPPQPAIATTAITAALDRMRVTRLEHHDLRRGLRLDLRLERLRVRLDRRERVVVAGDHLLRAHELGRAHAVVAVHRVVAADAHERGVDLVALLHELE